MYERRFKALCPPARGDSLERDEGVPLSPEGQKRPEIRVGLEALGEDEEDGPADAAGEAAHFLLEGEHPGVEGDAGRESGVAGEAEQGRGASERVAGQEGPRRVHLPLEGLRGQGGEQLVPARLPSVQPLQGVQGPRALRRPDLHLKRPSGVVLAAGQLTGLTLLSFPRVLTQDIQ